MNKMYKQAVAVLSLGLFLSFSVFIPKASAQYDNVNVSYNDFYQDLAPYGMWIDDPHYGYVWSPTVGEDFRPYYTNGYWVMTDYGNTWVSGYSWGWACFHYGRWIYDSYYGWLWIPGSNWGPAWVSWRYGEGYYGWAPLSPGYEFGSYGDYYCPNDWWVFIPPQYIYTGNYYRYWYGPHSNATIITNTTFVNNTYVNNGITYVSGPRQHDIEQVTHQPVQVFHITNSNNRNTRVHNSSIRMFRPAEVRPASTAGGQRVAPPNVVKAPQPIRNPQAVNKGQTTPPQFRNDVPQNNGRTATPGTGFNETAKPAQQQPARNDHNPYEWDANKQQHTRDMYQAPEQPQTQPQQRQFEQQPVQRNEPPRQAPAPAPQPRPMPAPQPRPMPAPQPRQAPPPPPQRPAPAPAPRETGGRR